MKKNAIIKVLISACFIAFMAGCDKDDSVEPMTPTEFSDFTSEVMYDAVKLTAKVVMDKQLNDAECGFVVAEKSTPTINDRKITGKKERTTLTASIEELKEKTTYYARVYVKKSATEYEYSEEISFSTMPAELDMKIAIEKPIDYPDATLSDINVEATNIASGEKNNVSVEQLPENNIVELKLKKGAYKLLVTGKMTYKNKQGVLSEAMLKYTEDITLDGTQTVVKKTAAFLYLGNPSGFVLEEIFFTSTLTPEGKPYSRKGDQYVKITNNSDETLYADGLALLESVFLTATKWEYKPDVMNEAFAVKAIYVVPGNGKEHPVKPGKSLIIANNAINHRKDNANSNPNSFDLSGADFEWYDVSPNPNVQDIDNPDVPNLDKYYAKTATIHAFHDRGFTAIAIAKVPVSKDDYLAKQKYDYTYIFKFGDFVTEMPGSAYKVPNAWIVDAVNLSAKGEFVWTVTAPALDAGWTYCSEGQSDKSRYGLAVRRKVDRETNGRKYYKDTNNSTDDFETRVKPSLMK